MSTLKEQLKKTEKLRQSTPDMRSEEFQEKYIGVENPTIIQRINKALAKKKIIEKICLKLNIDPIYLLLILMVPIIFLLLKYFTFTTTMIATLYPLYMSFKTLQYQVNKSKKNGKIYKKEDEDSDTNQWLSYWLLYAFINNMECILGSLVDKITFYKFFKFIFLLSCFLPQIQLSVILYNCITSKIFQLYGDKFERNVVGFMRDFFNNNNNILEEDDDNSNIKGDSGEIINEEMEKKKKNE